MLALCLMLTVGILTDLAQGQANAAKPAAPASPGATQAAPVAPASFGTTAAAKTTTKTAGAPTSQEIAAAKASGKVWVNTESGVYHKGGRWYGKTKAGKFMTEAEAKAAGYKEAHR